MTAPTTTERRSLAQRKATEIAAIMAKYPSRRSAVMPVLFLVQEEDGWVSDESLHEVAEVCGVHPSEVQEVTSFYTMFHREPVGKYVLWVCGTLPCALCGADGLFTYLKETLKVEMDEVTPDGLFTIKRIECLGACSEAPLMLINNTLHTKLTQAKVNDLLEQCRKGADFSNGITNSNALRIGGKKTAKAKAGSKAGSKRKAKAK
jgi:NADH-quinone oxidoreductase subunit E